MKHTRKSVAIAAMSAALLAFTSTPASARAEIDHWTEHIEHIEQIAHEVEGWCEDENGDDLIPFPVLYVEDQGGTFRGVVRKGVFYGATTIHREASWTNTENGKTFSFVWQGQEKDQKVTVQEDGTLVITILFTGPTQYYDASGAKLFKDVGRTFATIHIEADGDFIEFLGGDSKGQFDTADRDFCQDLLDIIG